MKELLSGNKVFILYLALSTLYLGVQMFQGLSYLDIGMYMSGYEHIVDDPVPSVFLGQWLLSFVTSSWVLRLFHADGFMAMRIMYLALTVVLQCVVYSYAKKYIPKKYIIAGLGLTTLSIYGAYTEINYNDYTLFFFLLAILSYHHGQSHHWGMLVLSGVLTGIAFYFRITNLALIVFPWASWLLNRLCPWGKWSLAQQVICFYSGWLIGIVGTYLFIMAIGMGDIMQFTLANIIQVGGNADDIHSFKNVLLCFYQVHKAEIAATSVIALLTLFIYWTFFIRKQLVRLLLLAVLFALVVLCIYFWEEPSSITIGICLFGLIAAVRYRLVDAKTLHLFALSFTLPLLAPLGSNAGAAFACKATCILSLSIALYIFARIGHLATFHTQEHSRAYRQALRLGIVAIGCAMVYTNINRLMMEDGNRKMCWYHVNSPLTGPIMTTQANAQTHNYLIQQVKPHLPKGSYLISNSSLTAVSLLQCKPYAVYSTIFSSDNMNRRYIDFVYGHTHQAPYILDSKNHNAKDLFVIHYLESKHPYKKIWSDGTFTLLAPR